MKKKRGISGGPSLSLAALICMMLASCVEDAAIAAEPERAAVRPFDKAGHYTRIAVMMNEGTLPSMSQAYGKEVIDHGVPISAQYREGIIQGQVTLLSQSKEVILSQIRCQTEEGRTECTFRELWISKIKGKPRSGESTYNLKRTDSWKWDGEEWTLAETALSDAVISN